MPSNRLKFFSLFRNGHRASDRDSGEGSEFRKDSLDGNGLDTVITSPVCSEKEAGNKLD